LGHVAASTVTLLSTLAKVGVGLAIYSCTVAIDNQSRELLKLIILEINGILKQLILKSHKASFH